jgi:N-terminal region of Chorein or VPS13
MESLVISIISKYLKDFVNNFRPEQITVNFLGGQGVMRDLDLNVQHINDSFLQGSTPSLKFTRILINKLSIEAPSILNIKSKPIIFFVDEMFIELSEMEEVNHRPKGSEFAPKKVNQIL